nr:MAG TPA: hypothetical protein [Bacteriophage sp.]
MKTRQAKKILKASFTCWCSVVIARHEMFNKDNDYENETSEEDT